MTYLDSFRRVEIWWERKELNLHRLIDNAGDLQSLGLTNAQHSQNRPIIFKWVMGSHTIL